ncbi:galactose-specific lectin nattectin-like [Poecilia reticulata]|uniref:galactose-specific lectin nattectin-like n=1 Tax=Poecilia reticulata TaxID=8081 RepID=UPI0007E99074|nr:PREDICTED: galactose-specific lectin nattectin-like [Poecilia reticulata]
MLIVGVGNFYSPLLDGPLFHNSNKLEFLGVDQILAPCLVLYLYLCLFLPAKSDLVKRSTDCPRAWTGFNGRCFRYIPKPMSWARAEKNCHSMKANLASVHDMEEYHEIQRLIMTASHEYKETWIGGTDAQEENHWFWIDGTPFLYTNWCPGEPNNHRRQKQDCLHMNHGGQKCWDDFQCYLQRPSVCAKKARFIY